MSNFNPKLRILILACICLLLAALSPFWGISFISPTALFQAGNPDAEVFWWLRFPRTIAAFIAGAGLAVSGMVFQAMFRNPLATPFTLGVSSGAAFGAAVYFWLGSSLMFSANFANAQLASLLGGAGSLGAALVGGLLSMGLVYLITRSGSGRGSGLGSGRGSGLGSGLGSGIGSGGGFSTPVMLLAGVIINFFFSSLVMFIQYLSKANDSLRIMHWLMGSLTGLEIPRLPDLAFIVLAGGLIIWRLSPEIDLLTAGEELAASRGVQVKRTKLILFFTASLIVGAVVSVSGPIGFVGMMVPHCCRLWLGPTMGSSHRLLFPAVFFAGGCFLCLCDLLARLVLAPAELPIGIITALLGAPFFLWILFRSGKNDCSAGRKGSGDLFQ